MIKCPLCEYESNDRSLCYVSRHLASKHGTSLEELYLKDHPRPACVVCAEPARWGQLEYQKVCGKRRCSGIMMRLNLRADPERYEAFVGKVKANVKADWARNARRSIGFKPTCDDEATRLLLHPIDAFLNSNPTWVPAPFERIIYGT